MINVKLIPASAIIPTSNRPKVLTRMLESLALQNVQPDEIIIIDASNNTDTFNVSITDFNGLESTVVYATAQEKGAASQRNQGIEVASQPYILFMDDDIILEPDCLLNLWRCISNDRLTGGVNAMITNQQYHTPGKPTQIMYRMMSGKKLGTYAGMCIGPAWNLLPEDDTAASDFNEVQWLNLGCTIYKKEALPNPVFDPHFKGYSLMEDLAMSLTVAKKWKLYNVRSAKIFHDSQPGSHKSSRLKLSKMELVNRQYIMTQILNKNGLTDYLKLFVFESWGILTGLSTLSAWKKLPANVAGKFAGIFTIMFSNKA